MTHRGSHGRQEHGSGDPGSGHHGHGDHGAHGDGTRLPAMTSVVEHRERILATLSALPAVAVPLPLAQGRVLAVDVVARVDVPGFENSAMDGYAVRTADTAGATPEAPVALRVVADLPAGSALDPKLAAGEAVRIMTGAPVPHDADGIVPVEDTDAGTGTVLVYRAPEPAAHIRRAGADVRAGEPVLPAGRMLGARDLAGAAAVGVR